MNLNTQVRILNSIDEFQSSRLAWNQLCGDRLFHRWEWMYSWWSHFQPTGELAIVVITESTSGKWLGLAPWFKTWSPTRGQVIRTLGSGTACSDYVSVVALPGCEDAVAQRLIEVMFHERRPTVFRNVDLFEFEGHRADDPVFASLFVMLAPEQGSLSSETIGNTWVTRLADSWEQFDGGLKKKFRRKTKKAIQRFEQQILVGQSFQSPGEIAAAWEHFRDLHQRRRQSLGQPGCFADPAFESFLKQATLLLAGTGDARINLLYWQDQPFACNLEFDCGRATLGYQTGMAPEHRNREPGHATFAWAIRNAIARKQTSFDFLRGDEPYKQFWNTESVPLIRTRVVPNRIRSNFRNSVAVAGKNLTTWARSFSSGTN